MLKSRILPAMLAAAIMVSAAGAVFAADATTPLTEKTKASALTKQQIKDIKMACKKDSKEDKAAYKACVAEKKKAAKGETAKPEATKAEAPKAETK